MCEGVEQLYLFPPLKIRWISVQRLQATYGREFIHLVDEIIAGRLRLSVQFWSDIEEELAADAAWEKEMEQYEHIERVEPDEDGILYLDFAEYRGQRWGD